MQIGGHDFIQWSFLFLHGPIDNLVSLSFLDNLGIFIEEGHGSGFMFLRTIDVEHLTIVAFHR
jgi:hypothetical protein